MSHGKLIFFINLDFIIYTLEKNSNYSLMFEKDIFIHHVYFWLKNPLSIEDRDSLVEGLKKLSSVTTIKNFHIGTPATTSREVIDSSYAISWLLLFNNKDDQDSYQIDPVHLKFVEDCKHLWSKVVVFDTIGI